MKVFIQFFICLMMLVFPVYHSFSGEVSYHTLAPQSFVPRISPVIEVFVGNILESKADIVVMPAFSMGDLGPKADLPAIKKRPGGISQRLQRMGIGSGIDWQIHNKALKKAEERGRKLKLDYVPWKNQSGTIQGNIFKFLGWEKRQHVFAIPLETKNRSRVGEQREEIRGRLSAMFTWAKANNIKTIDFVSIGTGSYRLNINDVFADIISACQQIGYIGKMTFYTEETQLADIEDRPYVKIPKEYKAKTIDSSKVMIIRKRIVDSYGMHARPAASTFNCFEAKGVKVVKVSIFKDENDLEPRAENRCEDGFGIMDFIIVAGSFGEIIEFTIEHSGEDYRRVSQKEISEVLNQVLVNEDNGLTTLYADIEEPLVNFLEPKKAGRPLSELNNLESSVPSFSNFIDTRLAQIVSSLIGDYDFPVIRHIPRSTEKERRRLDLVAGHLINEEFVKIEKIALREEDNVSLIILRRLITLARTFMRNNETWNAEFAVAVAAQRLYNQIEQERRAARIQRVVFQYETDLVVAHAKNFIRLIRKPFFYAFNTFPQQLETEYFRKAQDLNKDVRETLIGIIPHLETNLDKQQAMEETIENIINQMGFSRREQPILPWAEFSVLLEKEIAEQKEELDKKMYYSYLLLNELHRLYWLGESYLCHPFFDAEDFIGNITNSPALWANPKIQETINNLVREIKSKEKWSALKLYEFILLLISMRVDGQEVDIPAVVDVLSLTELDLALEALEPDRPTILATEKISLTSLKSLQEDLNILGLIVLNKNLEANGHYVRELRKMFPQAAVLISRLTDVNLGVVGNKSILKLTGLTGTLIADPSPADYKLVSVLEEELKDTELLQYSIFQDGQFAPLIYGHNQTLAKIGKVIHMNALFKGLRTLPQEERIRRFLETYHKNIPQVEPMVVIIFQNYHAGDVVTQREISNIQERDIKSIIETQIRALESFSKAHPKRKLFIVPQTTYRAEHFGDLLESFKYSTILRKNGRVISLVTDPFERNLSGTVYIHIDYIYDYLARREEGTADIRLQLKAYIRSMIMSKKLEHIYFVGDYLSNPSIALYIAGLNFRYRIKEGLPSVIMAVRDGNQLPLQLLFSNVGTKELLREIGKIEPQRSLLSLSREAHPSDEKLAEFIQWANVKLGKAYNFLLDYRKQAIVLQAA